MTSELCIGSDYRYMSFSLMYATGCVYSLNRFTRKLSNTMLISRVKRRLGLTIIGKQYRNIVKQLSLKKQ